MIRRTLTVNHKFLYNQIFLLRKQLFVPIKKLATHKGEPSDDPVPFLRSPAAKYDAKGYRDSLGRTNRPDSEPYIVVGSVSLLLIYFCILREESDVDQKLSGSLYDKVPELEFQNLREKQRRGIITSSEVKRLEQLEEILT